MFGPHVPSFGPSPCKVCIVAEAPGKEESDRLRPLVGPSGHELRRMMAMVGLNLDDTLRTNVFSRQPSGNNIGEYGVPKDHPDAVTSLPPLTKNPILFLHKQFLPELARLERELDAAQPNLILAFGNIACWALLHQQGITEMRGSLFTWRSPSGRLVKVLPTYHPAAILRQWNWRPILLGDLEKARGEMDSPELHYDNIELWLQPTIQDLDEFADAYMIDAHEIATDVETKKGQITCLSIAPRPDVAIVIPFWQEGDNPHYWVDQREEVAAWRWCAKPLEDPFIVKITQNGLYDIQYFLPHGITPRNFTEDTMLQSHSLWCEMRKSLGFLGATHANVPSWKHMRTGKVEEITKRDD